MDCHSHGHWKYHGQSLGPSPRLDLWLGRFVLRGIEHNKNLSFMKNVDFTNKCTFVHVDRFWPFLASKTDPAPSFTPENSMWKNGNLNISNFTQSLEKVRKDMQRTSQQGIIINSSLWVPTTWSAMAGYKGTANRSSTTILNSILNMGIWNIWKCLIRGLRQRSLRSSTMVRTTLVSVVIQNGWKSI